MSEVLQSVLDTIGETPLVRIRAIHPNPKVSILAKLEGMNPMGSVKERIALEMVEEAERDGSLRKGMTLVESSSGNTGIGLAMVAAVKRYPLVVTMSRGASVERRQILRALGSDVVLTPAEAGSDGAWDRADEIAASDPEKYFRIHQYMSPANAGCHYRTTGPEIWRQTGGNVDVFVVGLGTTGTVMGAGKYLKERNPSIRIVGVEPEEDHVQEGLRNLTSSRVPPIFDSTILDERVVVSDADAIRVTRDLALREGIFAGISSGTAHHAAMEVARHMEGGTIVVVFPDRGEKYLSTDLFFREDD